MTLGLGVPCSILLSYGRISRQVYSICNVASRFKRSEVKGIVDASTLRRGREGLHER